MVLKTKDVFSFQSVKVEENHLQVSSVVLLGAACFYLKKKEIQGMPDEMSGPEE